MAIVIVEPPPHRKVWDYHNSTIDDQQGGTGNQDVSLKDFRKDIILEVYNEAGQKVMAYNIPLLAIGIRLAARTGCQRQRGGDLDAEAGKRGLGTRHLGAGTDRAQLYPASELSHARLEPIENWLTNCHRMRRSAVAMQNINHVPSNYLHS